MTPTTISCCETPDDETAEPQQHEDRAVDDVAIAQSASVAGRADDIRVVAHEMALHLVEQALLLFGEWHASPSVLRWLDCTRAVPH